MTGEEKTAVDYKPGSHLSNEGYLHAYLSVRESLRG